MIVESKRTIDKESDVRIPKGISLTLRQRTKTFLAGAVYCWCKSNKSDFSAADLIGGRYEDWRDTPLHEITDFFLRTKGKETAEDAAGIVVGWLLRQVLQESGRTFRRISGSRVARYREINGGRK